MRLLLIENIDLVRKNKFILETCPVIPFQISLSRPFKNCGIENGNTLLEAICETINKLCITHSFITKWHE